MDASSYDKLPHITSADISKSGDSELWALLENATALDRWRVLYETNPELATVVLCNAYEASREDPEAQERVIGAIIKTLRTLNSAFEHRGDHDDQEPIPPLSA